MMVEITEKGSADTPGDVTQIEFREVWWADLDEAATHDAIWENYLAFRAELSGRVSAYLVPERPVAAGRALTAVFVIGVSGEAGAHQHPEDGSCQHLAKNG